MVVHSAQVYIQLKPLFSRHNGIGVQFTDEPTGSLDKDNSAIVIHCLRELAHELQRAVVIVTHDSDVARQCDRTFLLADGSLTPCAL